MLGGQSVSFLVDSGAAVSVVSYDILPPSARSSINRTAPLTIGANGIPLDVLGTVNVMVVLETIKVHQDFVVARKLTVECLLGMDFLSRHGAIIDCSKRKLTLVVHDKGKARHEGREGGTALVVNLAQTIKIPARSQLLVRGKMENLDNIKGEGLIEPVGDTQRGILVAHCVCKVDDSNEVPLQIVNTGLTDTILYEGTRVATFMEGRAVMALDNIVETQNNEISDVDLTSTELTEAERLKLKQLIWEFRSIFASEGSAPGRTDVVKHSIRVQGPPVREPLHRIPYSLQETVSTEVKKMLHHGVIRESNSPWSSPVVMVKKKDGSWRFVLISGS